MKKFTTQVFKELASLAENIPSGFRALFAKSDGLYTKNFAGVTLRLLTDGDSVSNADTLDSLHASAFARKDTAFTSSENIGNNYSNIKIYVLNAEEHQNLNTAINNLYNRDTNKKVIILQPGAYAVDSSINLENKGVLGIIGCSREDTLIQSAYHSIFSGVLFIENLQFVIKGEYSDSNTGTLLSSFKNDKSSFINNVIIKNTFTNNLNLAEGIRDFSSGNNIAIYGFSQALAKCYNFSNVNIDLTSTDENLAGYLVNDCKRITNINISFAAMGTVFYKCSEVSNFNIESGILNKTIAFDNCENISNGRINALKYGFSNSKFINNVYVNACYYGFSYSDKITLCFAEANTCGFYMCKGMVNNQTLNNSSSQYDTCYADMSNSYSVNDSYDGGWNY
ncbi:MAG: hypothetical protein ACOYO1_12790 [Bacteroidales bacterium]